MATRDRGEGRRAWQRLSPAERDARHRALQALTIMRSENVALSEAARQAGTTPANVRRYAGDALTRQGRGYRASLSDNYYRRMSVYGWNGRTDVDVHGYPTASVVGSHFNAVGRYLATGDPSYLDPFSGITVDGVELLTDPDRIEELARRRDLDIDDIYPNT